MNMSVSDIVRRLQVLSGRCTSLAAALALAATLAGPAPAAAEEAAEPEGAEAAAEEAAETSSAPSSEVFIPTEEISEDFAVSFPVDI